jgi:hypothetical protein
MAETFPTDSTEPLSEAELRSVIVRHLPAWKQACDTGDGDSIVLHEGSFGTSTYELFLFACAIKYAAVKGKHVHVASGAGRTKRAPETLLFPTELGSVYRENSAGMRHKLLQRTPKRMKAKE